MHHAASITNVSKPIAPMPALRGSGDWVTGTAYVLGQYVKSLGRYYMATVAGTSGATAPEGIGDVSDGTVTWVSCLTRPREGITFTNEGSIALSISMGGPAVAGSGLVLAASGGTITLTGDEVIECEFHAIRAAATAGNVSMLEW
jgi:hypothetical protein